MLLESTPQLLVFLVGLFLIKDLAWSYRFVYLQIIVSLITDTLAYEYIKTHPSNEVIYNVYLILEVVLLTAAFLSAYPDSRSRNFARFTLPVYTTIAVIWQVFRESPNLNFQLLSLGFIIIACLNLLYIIHPQIEKSPLKNPMLIISFGMLIYFMGVTPFFVSREFMLSQNPEMADTLFSYINNSLMIVRYSAYLIAFLILFHTKYFKKAA